VTTTRARLTRADADGPAGRKTRSETAGSTDRAVHSAARAFLLVVSREDTHHELQGVAAAHGARPGEHHARRRSRARGAFLFVILETVFLLLLLVAAAPRRLRLEPPLLRRLPRGGGSHLAGDARLPLPADAAARPGGEQSVRQGAARRHEVRLERTGRQLRVGGSRRFAVDADFVVVQPREARAELGDARARVEDARRFGTG
jgi:hypothetical protein